MMKAMILNETMDLGEIEGNPKNSPLEPAEVPMPIPGDREIIIKVSVCGVCRTELDEIEGRIIPARFPIIPGHQVVGRVYRKGWGVRNFSVGDRVGVAWIYSTCGTCRWCKRGNENLCDQFKATGKDAHGGYGQYMKVNENFAHRIPRDLSDTEAAPLLCAGAIGYRSLSLSHIDTGQTLGLMGFGASGHLVLKLVKHLFPHINTFVFSRSPGEREFARQLGAQWVGDITAKPPEKLNSIIDTTPAWKTVIAAMENLEREGRLVINAIRKEKFDKNSLLELDYPTHLWMEKEIKTVANVTRKDVSEFLHIAAEIPIVPEVEQFPLEEANRALLEIKRGNIRGARVLRIE